MKKCKPETRTVDYDSLKNKRVNEIDELYSGPKSREHCRESAREIYEQTAKFVQKVVDDPKIDLSNCPWPFGLIILEGHKEKKPGEAKYTPLYGPDRTDRPWKIPGDISAVHTLLALYRDERLGGDEIVTDEILKICPEIGTTCPLVISNTAEMLERQIPALIRCAREDLKDKKKIMAIKSWRITRLLRKLIKRGR